MTRLFLLVLVGCSGADKDSPDDTGATDSNVDSDTDTGPEVIDDTGETGETGDTEDTGAELAAYEAFYDMETVQVIHLTLDSAAIASLQADPETYVEGSFEHGGTVLKSVGVRLRGNETWDEKPGFQVKFQEFGGDEYAGLERVLLDNQWGDSTMVRAPLAYEAFRNAGLVAPRANYAEVHVNGEYFGLYANIEAIDDQFAGHHWADPAGDLYDADNGADFYEQGVTFFTLVSGKGDDYALRLAWEAVQPPYTTSFYVDTQAAIDLPAYFRYFGWLLVTGTNEGYPYEQNDYAIYLNPQTGLYEVVPWGLDQAWAVDWTWEPHRGFLAVLCELDADCLAAMRAAASTALAEADAQDLAARAGELYAISEDAVKRDTRSQFPASQVAGARSAFQTTLDGWNARVRTAMGL